MDKSNMLAFIAAYVNSLSEPDFETLRYAVSERVKKSNPWIDPATPEFMTPSPAEWAIWNSGKKIEAIKTMRERTNCGLKYAKDTFEAGELVVQAGLPAPKPSLGTISFGQILLTEQEFKEAILAPQPNSIENLFRCEGQTLKAIKAYRDRTGQELGVARNVIFGLTPHTPETLYLPQHESWGWNEGDKVSGVSAMEWIHLFQRGQKISAIKLYRERTGAGLPLAKWVVENSSNKLTFDKIPA